MDFLFKLGKIIKRIAVNTFTPFLRFGKRSKRHQAVNIKSATADMDQKLVLSLSKSRVPNISQLKYINKYLSQTEKWVIRICALTILASLVALGTGVYKNNLQLMPVFGGEYTEGLVGMPKFVNPLYSNINDVDNDISLLVFSSLFKRDRDGKLVGDLAEKYDVSDDQKVYTVVIKENIKWHDGENLTIDDVIFTFNAIQDKNYQSPLRNNFSGVLLEKADSKTIRFVLKDPYAAFPDLLTYGILPAHIWSQIPLESVTLTSLNLKPIGSGPYKFDRLAKDSNTGEIRDYFLTVNEDYYGPKPMVNLKFRFFPNSNELVDALNQGLIDGINYLPFELREAIQVTKLYSYHQLNMPQITLIFFNQEALPALKTKEVRQALNFAIDKQRLIANVLGGNAKAINSPVLESSFAYHEGVKKYEYDLIKAENLLDQAGWKKIEVTEQLVAEAQARIEAGDESTREEDLKKVFVGPGKWRQKDGQYLIIQLTTIDRLENTKVVEEIKKHWESVGARTEITVVSAAAIQSEVIKPRSFQALFYGQILSLDPDTYSYWHSSQAKADGFNLAYFKNKDADKLLEDGRITTDQAQRREKYVKFQEIIAEELPAIFMYSPYYLYLQDKKLQGFDVKTIASPQNRFANIEEWYLKTGKRIVW